MKRRTYLSLVLSLLIAAGCGAPAAAVTAAPTIPAIPTLAARPSATPSLPATAAPPTAAATVPAAAATPAAPTPAPTLAPTAFTPLGGGRFSGAFPNGEIVFRLNDAGTFVTLKEITLAGAPCGGKKINKHMTFESISFFEIEAGKFSFEVEQATVSGQFDAPDAAHGSVTLEFSVNKTTCIIGPLAWTARGAR